MEDGGITSERVEFRQLPSTVRRNRAFFGACVAIVLVWSIAVIANGYWFWLPIGVLMTLIVMVAVRVDERLFLVAEGDTLVLCNAFRTRTLRRQDISRFAVDKRWRNLEVLLKDGSSVHADVMAAGRGPRRPDIIACRDRLTEWLLSSPPSRG